MHSPPEDSWYLAYFIFFLQESYDVISPTTPPRILGAAWITLGCPILDVYVGVESGIGQLFPWNAIINAEEYFRRRFCGTSFETSFENSFALGYNTSAIVGIVIALRYFDNRNLRFRVMGSLAVSTLVFGAYGVIVLMENINTALLFFFTLGSIFASGLAVAFSQAGLFSMASAFPPKYTQAMMAGQGLAGLAVALSGLFTTLAGPDDQSCIPNDHAIAGRAMSVSETPCASYTRDWSALAYFSVAVAVLLGCLVTFPVLQRLPVVAFYTPAISDSDESVNGDGDDGINDVVSNDDIEDEDSSNCTDWSSFSSLGVQSNIRPRSMHRRLVEAAPKRLLPSGEALSDSVVHQKPLEEGVVGGDVGASDTSLYVGVTGLNGLRSKLAPVSLYGFALFFTFLVTLAVFPGATSLIVSSRQCRPGRSRFFAPDVFVMFSFVSFNAFDFLGRLASGLWIVLPPRWLPFAALLRLVFVPLLLACRSEHSRFSYRWLWDDVFPLSIMPMFAFTNGYVGSLSVIAGSQKGPWASTAMMLFLSAGLLAGSMLSFLVLYASTKS